MKGNHYYLKEGEKEEEERREEDKEEQKEKEELGNHCNYEYPRLTAFRQDRAGEG